MSSDGWAGGLRSCASDPSDLSSSGKGKGKGKGKVAKGCWLVVSDIRCQHGKLENPKCRVGKSSMNGEFGVAMFKYRSLRFMLYIYTYLHYFILIFNHQNMNPNWDALTPTSLEWLTRLAPSTQSTQHRPRRGFCGFLILGEGRDVAVEIGDHISGSLSERGTRDDKRTRMGQNWSWRTVFQEFRKLEFHDGRNQVPIFEVPQENHDGTTRKFICFLMGESV